MGPNYINYLYKPITSNSPGKVTKKSIKKKMIYQRNNVWIFKNLRTIFNNSAQNLIFCTSIDIVCSFILKKRKLICGPDDDYGVVKMGCEIFDMLVDEYLNK